MSRCDRPVLARSVRNQRDGSRPQSEAIRLAVCTAGEIFGGVERHVLDFCKFVRERSGHCPLLALFHDRELAARARTEEIPTVVLRGRHRYDLRLCSDLMRFLDSERISVLQLHGYKATVVGGLTKWRMGRLDGTELGLRRLVLVKTEHGIPEPSSGLIHWSKVRLNVALDCAATRLAADVVCYVTAELAAHYELLHRGLARCVIHNGIQPLDKNAFHRPDDLEHGLCHLGIIGRLAPVKGIRVAIRALASAGLSSTVVLNVVGAGPSEHALRNEASALHLGGRVRFLGFRRDIYDYIAHLDAILIPSLHEGLPYTLLEAMSMGVPIVASNVGGLAEVMEDGRTGVLVPPGDEEALASAITHIVTRPEWARSLGVEAAREQRRAYTVDAMGEAYWCIYNRALRGAER